MMESGNTFTGRTLDESLSAACEGIGGGIEELQYEVVEEGSGGVTIEAHLDPVAILGLFLSETFRAGGLDLRAQLRDGDSVVEGELSGSDFHLLTAGFGKGLDALQYLCNRIMNRRLREHHPVHLDGDGFKERRADRLQDDAESAADQALRKRGPVTMGPFTPAARREIHLALADDPDVETESDGEGFLKRVVVRPTRRR